MAARTLIQLGWGRCALAGAVLLTVAPVLAILGDALLGARDVGERVMETRLTGSVLMATVAAVLSVAIGVGTGCAVWLARGWYRSALLALAVVPLALPPYVLALAWSPWFGFAPAGVLTVRQSAAFLGATPQLATVMVWALWLFPLPMLASLAAASRWNARWSEAVHATRLPPAADRWLRLRFAFGPVTASALLAWLLAFSDFSVPDYFGARVYATEVFAQLSAYGDVAGAIAASVGPGVAAGFATALLLGAWRQTTVVAGLPAASRPVPSGTASVHVGTWVGGVGVLVLVGVPVTSLAAMTRSFDVLPVALAAVRAEFPATTLLAGATAMFVVVLAALGGRHLARTAASPSAWVIALIAALAIPSAFVGLGSILIWNQPGTFGAVYTSGGALLLALVARWAPAAVVIAAQVWRSAPLQAEQAAELVAPPGSGLWLRTVLRPLAYAFASIGLVVFVLAFNELTLTALLAPPGFSTLPLRVFSVVHYGPAQMLGALALVQVALVACAVALVAWLWRGGRRRGA